MVLTYFNTTRLLVQFCYDFGLFQRETDQQSIQSIPMSMSQVRTSLSLVNTKSRLLMLKWFEDDESETDGIPSKD